MQHSRTCAFRNEEAECVFTVIVRFPKVFGLDLFSLLESNRPDYRWFLVGPARSGAPFHKVKPFSF